MCLLNKKIKTKEALIVILNSLKLKYTIYKSRKNFRPNFSKSFPPYVLIHRFLPSTQRVLRWRFWRPPCPGWSWALPTFPSSLETPRSVDKPLCQRTASILRGLRLPALLCDCPWAWSGKRARRPHQLSVNKINKEKCN